MESIIMIDQQRCLPMCASSAIASIDVVPFLIHIQMFLSFYKAFMAVKFVFVSANVGLHCLITHLSLAVCPLSGAERKKRETERERLIWKRDATRQKTSSLHFPLSLSHRTIQMIPSHRRTENPGIISTTVAAPLIVWLSSTSQWQRATGKQQDA